MKSNETTKENNPFQDRIENFEDKELLNVIKNVTDYQPQAVEVAVMTAIKRNLITQEDGEKILNYTDENIEKNKGIFKAKIIEEKKKGRLEIVLGIITFVIGMTSIIFSYHSIWIGAIIFGPILFFRGLFKQRQNKNL